jgi:hypothetical protein
MAATFVELPPNTTHTFINNTEEDFGIPVNESRAQEKSVSEQVVQSAVRNVESYGMYLAE